MGKVKNMGTSTAKFKEGIILTGSFDSNDTSLVLSGTVKIGLGTNDYTMPITDGSANQYIKTDGNGNLTFSTVSASGGTYIQDADANTKIQTEESSDENKIRFDTAGSERMIIDENGKVGIGTSSPSSTLTVNGNLNGSFVATIDNDENTNGHVLKLLTDGNGSGSRILDMEDGDGDIVFRARADGRFGFGPDGVSSMGAGTFVVGIANSSHTSDIAISQRLQHLGDSNTYLDFPAADQLQIVVGGVDALHITENDSQDQIVFNEAAADIDFRVEGSSSTHLLFLDAGNNKIGIGTSSPGTLLDVEGTANISGTTYLSSLAEHTKHSVLLVTGSSNQVSSSASFKFNASKGSIGIGMDEGGATDGGSTPAYSAGNKDPNYRIHVIGDINNGAAFACETYASSQGGPKFRFIKARGTPASPSAVQANDEAGRIEFYSHTGTDTFTLSGMILCQVDADGDGRLSFRSTHAGSDNEAFYCHDNRVYFVDQVRIGNVIAPESDGSTNIGGVSAKFEAIHGNNLFGHESVKVGNTTMFGQSGYGITAGFSYAPHTDTPGNDAQSSHMSAFTYASSVTATRNVAFNLVKTGSHTVGVGTCGTGDTDEKFVFFAEHDTTSYEWRTNVGTEPLLMQSGSLLMVLSSSGGLGIGAPNPIAKLDVAGKIAITSESSTPSQPSDGQGYLYTKSDGKLYWRSYDVTETDLTSGGGGGSGGGAKAQYLGFVSLQTTARVVSYDLGANLSSTANNNIKGMIIAPFDGKLDYVIVSTKGVNVDASNTGNVTVSAYKNQNNFASSTDVTVAHSGFQQKASGTPNIYSGQFDFDLSVSAGDVIQIKVGKSTGSNTDTLVTIVFTAD